MPAKTTNFNLIKPGQEEFYNVNDQNANMDTIDGVLKTLQDAINSGATEEEIAQIRQELATHSADAVHLGNNAACFVNMVNNQSVANNTATALSFTSEEFDNDNIHDNSVNPSRLICKTAGKYHIFGKIASTGAGNGFVALFIRVNNSYERGNVKLPVQPTGDQVVVSTVIDLKVNDYVELCIYQTTDSSLTILGGSLSNFGMVKVG